MSETAPAPEATTTLDALRTSAAESVGLHPALTEHLRGESIEELVADARRLRAVTIGADEAPAPAPAAPVEGLDGGTMREQPSAGSVEAVRYLAKSNPREFNRQVDQGLIDLSTLRRA